ncbi:MAG: O-antigen ligase family protein [Pyrinomonadaceae bacterium]
MQAFEKKEYSSLSGHTSASRRPRDIEPLTPAERPRRVLDADKFSREPVHLPTANPSLSDPDASRKVLTNPESRTQKIKGQKPSREELDEKALASDNWLVRNGHSLTFIGLYLFSILVLFRPYELLPSLGFLSATAFYFALATLLIYLPSQLATEGNATIFTTEIKAILALTALAFFSIPLAKDTKLAWDTFNDPFIKAVLIFIVLVNVVRTQRRLMALLWLSIGIGIYLGFTALRLYTEGKFAVEEYRVAVDVGGLFGNPNDMALHFVMMTPIVLCLALGTRSKAMRVLYFAITVLFISANMVTFSRGGFLGFFASALVLVWKLGRKHRAKVSLVSIVVGGILMIAAPGNYGLRMLSIFIPGLDPVGSSTQRRELLDRSLLVTARNPWGIGIGNFPIVGIHEHQTHNAYTQVSSEIGILGLIAYLVFIISPLRKLSAIERTLFSQDRLDWFYYLSIGLQASIIGYMVSSFFSSVAYNWFIYYGIAYAVAFRRIYSTAPEPSKQSVVEPAFAAA